MKHLSEVFLPYDHEYQPVANIHGLSPSPAEIATPMIEHKKLIFLNCSR
jgi:hypothetical protein